MNSDLIENRHKNGSRISYETWWDIFNEYINQLEFEGRVGIQLQDIEDVDPVKQVNLLSNLDRHPVFRTPPTDDENWARLMPDDSITRINNSSDLFDEFSNITEETAKNILDADPGGYEDLSERSKRLFSSDWTSPLNDHLEPTDFGYVAMNIASRLSGSIDFLELSSDPGVPEMRGADTPEGSVTVTIEGINSNNYEDWEIYEIKDAKKFFGASFGSNLHMAYEILNSDIAPMISIPNISFYLEGMSVQGLDCPQGPISLVSMDGGRNTAFFESETPEKVFDKSWGDTSKMGKQIDELERLGSPVTVDWRIVTGIN